LLAAGQPVLVEFYNSTDGMVYLLLGSNQYGPYTAAEVGLGGGGGGGSAAGLVVAEPLIALSATASTIVLNSPATGIKVSFKPGATALPVGDVALLMTPNPANNGIRDAMLDETAAGQRIVAKYDHEPQIFTFSAPVTSLGIKAYATGNASPLFNSASVVIEALS
jgi:hypothetical protein